MSRGIRWWRRPWGGWTSCGSGRSSEHAEVYADLHERLQSALVEADAEHGDRG